MIEVFADWVSFKIFRVPPDTAAYAGLLKFFIHYSIKIVVALAVISLVIALLRTIIRPRTAATILARYHRHATVLAPLLGVITQHCFCRTASLLRDAIQLKVAVGAATSWLLASRLMHEVVLAAMWSVVGTTYTLLYMFLCSGILIVLAKVINRLPHIKTIVDGCMSDVTGPHVGLAKMDGHDRMLYARNHVWGVIRKYAWRIVMGVLLAATINSYLSGTIISYLASVGHWALMPLLFVGAVLCSAAPLIVAIVVTTLALKGLPLGVAIVLLLSASGMWFERIFQMRTVLKGNAVFIICFMLAGGIIFLGYIMYPPQEWTALIQTIIIRLSGIGY